MTTWPDRVIGRANHRCVSATELLGRAIGISGSGPARGGVAGATRRAAGSALRAAGPALRAAGGRTRVQRVNRLAGRPGATRARRATGPRTFGWRGGTTGGGGAVGRRGPVRRSGPLRHRRPVRRRGPGMRRRAIGRSGLVRRRGPGMRRGRVGRRGAVGRCGPMGRRGTMTRHGLARRHGRSGPRCLSGTQTIAGRHGLAFSRRMGYPAGTGGVHSCLVSRARRLSSGTTCPGPVLGPSATRGTSGHRRRGRLTGARAGVRIRDPGGPWTPLSLCCPNAVRGSVGPRVGEGSWVARAAWLPRGPMSPSPRVFRPADIPGHVEQAARRVHARRIQDVRPGRTSPRPAPAGERENHQHDQAERDTRRAHIQPQAGHTARRLPRQGPHGQAQDHQDDAERDRRGARNRQDDDKSHPSAGSGI